MNIIERVARTIKFLIAVLMVILVGLVFAQVFYRYILSYPLSWSEELARFVMIWLLLLATSLGVRTKAHAAVEILLNYTHNKSKKIIVIISHLCTLMFGIILAVYGVLFTLNTGSVLSTTLNIPMSFIYLSVPVSGILIVLFQLENSYIHLFKRNEGSDSI